MIRLVFSLPYIVMATAANAQMWNTISNPQDGYPLRGAYMCTDDGPGNDVCLIVGCGADTYLDMFIALDSAAEGQAKDVALAVDGAAVFSVPAEVGQPPFDGFLVGNLERAQLETVVARLSAGAFTKISINEADIELSLRGSSSAIARASEMCSLPAPAPIKDPVAVEEAAIMAECSGMGGGGIKDGFAEEIDLDGRDPVDLIINYGYAQCGEFGSYYCGSGGCRHSLYLGVDGGYRHMMTDTFHGIETAERVTIAVASHGSACGRVGAAGCTRFYSVMDGKLEFLGTD